MVHVVSSVAISSTRIDEIRGATLRDESLQELNNVIVTGWPDVKDYLTPNVKQYFSYRDELTVQDGIIFRGERVVIPQSMRKGAKEKVHHGHLGINVCLRRARDVMYWPGMSADIRQYVETCGVCATYPMKQGDESLQISDVPDRPWQRVASDLCSFNNRDYLVTVDYFSGFFELDHLNDTSSETVINQLKLHFARHGIPDSLTTDNGPQYSSGI